MQKRSKVKIIYPNEKQTKYATPNDQIQVNLEDRK